jgi:GNAT superfamily N-acetyltransferase
VAETLTIEPARKGDLAEIDALLARSYPVLLKPDYPPSVLVTALPLISRAQPRLLASGTYYVARDGERIVGAGGWTAAASGRARARGRTGHIRHLVTDHARTREGIGRALMLRVFETAQAEGIVRLDAQATRTAVPFYRAMGFDVLGEIGVPLRPGIVFPAVAMARVLG